MSSPDVKSPALEAAEILRVQAEAEKLLAERDQIASQIRETEAKTREATANAFVAENNARVAQEKYEREHAADRFHHVYRFNGSSISETSTRQCIDELTIWHRLNPECPIEIIMFSPGGDVIAGMDLFDFLQDLRREGHHITIHARGYAASMGGILLQAADHRVMGREAYVLIHEVHAGVVGKIGEIKDEVKFIEKMSDRVLNLFAAGSAKAFEAGTSEVLLSADQFRNGDTAIDGVTGWNRTDWWLTSDECLRFGVVDEVR